MARLICYLVELGSHPRGKCGSQEPAAFGCDGHFAEVIRDSGTAELCLFLQVKSIMTPPGGEARQDIVIVAHRGLPRDTMPCGGGA